MNKYIKKDFVRRLVENADIVGIINTYIPLEKAGTRYKARCPFHNEKTPSFVVTPDMGRYYCFGCHANGDVLDFIREIEKVDFADAVEKLADIQGVNVEYEENNFNNDSLSFHDRKELYECMKDSANYYYKNLINDKQALNYLLDRGIKKETIKYFGLGYSKKEYEDITKYLMNAKGYKKESLLKVGLVKENDKGMYEYFRNRIMFPIQDINGKIIAFGGRIFNNEDNTAKYLNSPETDIFKKNSTLYNMNRARKEISNKPLVLVEGYMDVISLVNYGIKNVVATLGTAFNINHAKLISRYTTNVIVMYDSDTAGQKATIKASEILESCSIYPKIVRLPKGEDPDSYIQNNSTAELNNLLDNGMDSIEFRIKLLSKKYNMVDNWDKVNFTKEACKIIAKVDDEIRKEMYIKLLHNKTGAEIYSIEKEIETKSFLNTSHINQDKKNTTNNNEKIIDAKKKIINAQETIFKYIIENQENKEKISKLNLDEELIVGTEYKQIYKKLAFYINSGKRVDISQMFDYNDKLATTMSRIVSLDRNIKSNDIDQAVNTLVINNINKKIARVKNAIKDIETAGDKELLDVLIAEFYKLKTQLLKAKNGGIDT